MRTREELSRRIGELENNLNCENDHWHAETVAHENRVRAWGDELDQLLDERDRLCRNCGTKLEKEQTLDCADDWYCPTCED